MDGTMAATQGVSESLSHMSAAEQAAASSVFSVEEALQNEMTAAYDATAATMAIENAIQKSTDAMNIASANAANYRSEIEQVTSAMDRNASILEGLEKQQTKTYSDKRQSEIEKIIAKQDRLNGTYQKTEVALTKANATYGQQQSKVQQLNQKLTELVDKNNQVQKQGSDMKNPFDKWAIRITGINSALRLTTRILRTITSGFNTIMGATGEKWEGVMRKFNNSITETQKTIGEKLLPLAAIGADLFAQAFDWIGQKANEAINWILDNIDLVTNSLALFGTAALAVVGILAIANWQVFAIISVVVLLASVLTDFGVTAEQILGFVGGLFGVLYAGIYNDFARLWNTIAAFANFFGNVFKDPIGAVQVLFLDLALNVIGYVEMMVRAIEDLVNQIPGVEIDITSGISNYARELKATQDEIKAGMEWEEFVKPREFKSITETALRGAGIGAGIGEKLTGIVDALKDFNLDDYSTPDNKALNVKNTKPVKIDSEDIKMLLDIATRDYQVTYQTLTPQIAVNVDTIRESADVNQVIEVLADWTEEVANSSLWVPA